MAEGTTTSRQGSIADQNRTEGADKAGAMHINTRSESSRTCNVEESSPKSYEEVEVVVSAGIHQPPPFSSKKRRMHRVSSSSNSSSMRRYGISLLISLLLIAAYYNNTSVVNQIAKLHVSTDVSDTATTTAVSANKMLPDWRIVTECSAYNTDCASHIRGRLLDYPFKVKTVEENVGEDGEYAFERIGKGELPEEWSRALEEFAPPLLEDPPPLQLDGDRQSALVFPSKVSSKKAKRCYKKGLSTSFDEQLDTILSKLQPIPDIDSIAFTMSDEKYSRDMLVDVWEMNNAIVGFRDAFFFLALDKFTLQLACDFGYPVVAAPALTVSNNNDDAEVDLKSLVQSTKFIVSRAIVDRNQHFFFYEMDCWFIKSPIDLLRQQRTDYLVSSHQWNAIGGNIGIYSVRANKATQEFFQKLVEYSDLSPKTHDQIAMNDFANYSTKLRNGERVSDVARDYLGRWDPIPKTMPKFKNPIAREYFDPHVMVASPNPVPTETTIAIHTLDNTPLQPPHGKKMVAKELGAYTGFVGTPEATGGGYYKRTGARRRYLMMDGRVLGGYSSVQRNVYHDYLQLQWHIAVLVALARRTDRIFVLPRIASDYHVLFLWANLDMQSLEGLVDVRETNFPSNKKAWYSQTEPFESVARVALFSGSRDLPTVKVDGRLFAQISDSDEIFAWDIEGESQKVDALFGLVSASTEIHEAEALFVNPSFTPDYWDWRIGQREMNRDLSPAEKEILYVFDHLKWCGNIEHEKERPAVRYSSAQDCYGKGIRASRFGNINEDY